MMLEKRSLAIGFFLACFVCLNAQTGNEITLDSLRADSLLGLSSKFNKIGKLDSAFFYAQEGFRAFTDLFGYYNEHSAVGRMYVARILENQNRQEEAIPLFKESLQVFETIRDTAHIAVANYYIGLCLRILRRVPEAKRHCQTAIDLLLPDSANHAGTLADFRVGLSSMLNQERDYLAALPFLEKAKSFYLLKNNQYNISLVSFHLGNAFFGLKDYERAKEQYFTSYSILKGILPQNHTYLADLLGNIGFCWQKTGDSEKALSYLLEAEAIYKSHGEEDYRYLGFLDDLGSFFYDEGRYDEAAAQFERCVANKEMHFGKSTPRLLMNLPNLGAACLKAKKYGQAESCFRRTLKIIADSLGNDYRHAHRFYRYLAEIRFENGDFDGCLRLCDSAFQASNFDFEHPEKMVPRNDSRDLCQLYGQTLARKSLINNDLHLARRADRFFEMAAQILFREVEEITVNSSRELFFDRDHEVLEQWLDSQMRLFQLTGERVYAENAFQISGKNKAFLLSEAMRRSGALRFAGLADSVLQQEFRLRAVIAETEKKLESKPRKGAEFDATDLELSQKLANWRTEYDVLMRQIRQEFPDFQRRRFSAKDVSLDVLRKEHLAPGQTLLMFGLGESQIHVFVLNQDSFVARSLPLDFPLDETIEIFRGSVTKYHSTPNAGDELFDQNLDLYLKNGRLLFEKLIAPVEVFLTGRVVVVPEGKLCYLPFEALLDGSPGDEANFKTYPFWARQKAISYCFSTDLLVEMSKPTALKPARGWLGIAPFVTESGGGVSSVRTFNNEELGLLPFSGKEVLAIAEMTKGEVWLKSDASPGRFESEAPKYRTLHLATHSRADERQGHRSFLATASTGEPMPALDLYRMALAAEMVVLSSCEAGGGKLNRGEGIIGLVRAFAFAGARSIVASTWVADDRGTANLMIEFYRELQKGLPRDVALNRARLNFLGQFPGEAHPFFWGGFRVFGSVD